MRSVLKCDTMKETVLRLAMLATSQADSKEWSLTMSDSIPPHDDLNKTPITRRDGSVYYQKRGGAPKNIPIDKKYCPQCEKVLDVELFSSSKSGKLRAYCKACTNLVANKSYTTEKGHRRNLRRMYDLPKEEYDLMFFQQCGLCACCGEPEKIVNWRTKTIQGLAVDHDHKTGKVRALLCQRCNILIEHVEPDQDVVKKAIKYLNKHNK